MKKQHLLLIGTALMAALALQPAFAAGGLEAGTTALTQFKTWFYGAVAIGGIIYLLYLGVMAKSNKKTWSDFGWGAVHVACVGASPTIAEFMYNLFV